MKKLLSLLSVLTISGTAVPTTIAASHYQKQEKDIKLLANDKRQINYKQQNNSKTLNRRKRYIENKNSFYSESGFPFERDRDIIIISPDSWEEFIQHSDSKYNFMGYFKNGIGLYLKEYLMPQYSVISVIDRRIDIFSEKLWDNFNQINNLWKKSNRNKSIKIVFYTKNLFEVSDLHPHLESFRILDEENIVLNKYLDKMLSDFDGKLSKPGDIDLGLIEDANNNSILNRLKEMFPKLDISQFEVIEKNQYSFLRKNFSAKIDIKRNSNIYPIESFKKELIFISKKFLKEEMPRILGQENLIQNWTADFNEWRNEINRQKLEDLPKYGNDERGNALKRTWKGNHLSELKNKLLSLNHILETIDNKFKISELYKTVQGLQKDINDLKQQISELNQKIDNIRTDLEGNTNLETCTKTGALISATTGWIPVIGTLISTVSGTISAICDIANT